MGLTRAGVERFRRRRRLGALAVLAAVIVAGLAAHFLLPDTAATDIAGDALYAAAAYTLVVAIAPAWHPLFVALVAGGWCCAVELFQLTGVPLALGARFAPAMLVLGTAFDARDLVVYVATVAVLACVDRLAARWTSGPQRPGRAIDGA